MIAAAKAGPDAILIPKVSTPGDIMLAAKAMRDAGAPDHTRIWIMMETPVALLNADSIVRTAMDPASRLAALVMGTNDIAKETRARLTPGRPSMLAYLSICVAAARAYGAEIIDGVYNDFSNEAGFRAECEQGRDFGMDGKTLIHPNQIAVCNEVFAPAGGAKSLSRGKSSKFSTCRKIPSRARCRSMERWSRGCMRTWRGGPSLSPKRSPPAA